MPIVSMERRKNKTGESMTDIIKVIPKEIFDTLPRRIQSIARLLENEGKIRIENSSHTYTPM